MSFKSSFIATCLLTAMTTAAHAGGAIAPVVQTDVVAVPVENTATDWGGAYVGGWIGYATGADDRVGVDEFDLNGELESSLRPELDLDVRGVNAGLNIGYRWQIDNWVFGPELFYERGNIDDELSYSGDHENGATLISKVNYVAGLQFKGGFAFASGTLLYGSVGYVRGDFDYDWFETDLGDTIIDETKGYNADGYSLGLGVERKLSEKWSIFGEWQYRNFGKTNISYAYEDGSKLTRATPEHHNFKLGVNFQF
ncbi:outer membrane protein [Paracoccus fistulariae]|uniref:Porin family protein n=1 Tax=Paracoccus fistulariae TaxID=658446 RepID=A0ABY7SH13_9RHOB|nr:outer membrane beta-barrel protein [Paracoccus fistulariae]MDB6181009.1 outer membrane beta-barrel protein [Paracoccus fistulariae]WCR06305.1 porin family protein [Paracoccus fistulariae]